MGLHLFMGIGSVSGRFRNISSVTGMWFNVTFFGAVISAIYAFRPIVSGVITLGKG